MTRAERAAEKAYPPLVVKTLHGEFDCNAYARLLFWRGYQKALGELAGEAVEAEVWVSSGRFHDLVIPSDPWQEILKKYDSGDKVKVIILKAEEEM